MNYEDRVTKEYVEGLLEGMPKIVTGTYTGDGEASRFIDLGAAPKAVLVASKGGQMHEVYNGDRHYYGGLALPGYPAGTSYGTTQYNAVAITGTGFTVCRQTISMIASILSSNLNGILYYYIAIL